MARLLQHDDDIKTPLWIIRQKLHPSTLLECALIMQSMQSYVKSRATHELIWRRMYLDIASFALSQLGDQFNDGAFIKLLMGKQELYGSKPIENWGNLGVMIRIDSKLERYINLKNNPNIQVGDESIVDTLTDIIGYCVLGYNYDLGLITKRTGNEH